MMSLTKKDFDKEAFVAKMQEYEYALQLLYASKAMIQARIDEKEAEIQRFLDSSAAE